MLRRRELAIGAGAAGLAAPFTARRLAAQAAPRKVLRVVPHAEPQVFDPHQSGVNITSMHAGLVYDTLFSWDADMVARPQMVERWTKSDDGLLYTFTLREGLKFHDGSPVTTRDVVATLKRLLIRDTQNQILAGLLVSMDPVDARTFTLRLREPFGYTEFMLSGSNGVSGGMEGGLNAACRAPRAPCGRKRRHCTRTVGSRHPGGNVPPRARKSPRAPMARGIGGRTGHRGRGGPCPVAGLAYRRSPRRLISVS